MAKIQELLEGKDERIDYGEIIKKFPWIVEKNQKCILSPDSDGLLCGLFMSHFLDWQIKGFYDNGKLMLLQNGISATECVFLDTEIFRKNIRSVGHHIVLYNSNKIPESWDNFDNCIQTNNMRSHDGLHTFRLKYPLATIHLLIGILGSRIKVEIPPSAICALLFTDGVYQVLFKYPENVLNWLQYLRANEKGSSLYIVFGNERYSVFGLMQAMNEFFRKRDKISIRGERGDLLRVSDTDGSPCNIAATGDTYGIDQDAVRRVEQFIKLLEELTAWDYKQDSWAWTNMDLYRFTKRSFKQDELRVNGQNFQDMVRRNPLSWAMTENTNIEYTLEEPDRITEC